MKYKDLIDHVDLIQYIQNQGFKKNDKKSSRGQLVFDNVGGEKIVVLEHRVSKELIYKNLHDSNDRGNIGNFVINRLDGFVNTSNKTKSQYAEAANILKEYLNIPKDIRSKVSTPELKPKKQEPFTYSLYKPETLKDSSYLESRGISKETITSELFQGTIINCQKYDHDNKRNYGNLMTGFPCLSNQKIIGLDMRSAGWKGFARGSKKEESFWASKYYKDQDNLVLGESPIDILSYHQIKGETTNFYLSSNGTLTSIQLDKIKVMLDKNIFQTITSINDRDFAGYKFDLMLVNAVLKKNISKITSAKKEHLDLEITYKGLEPKKEVVKSTEELKVLVDSLIKSYQLEEKLILDKAPNKDWNEVIDTNLKKKR